MWPDVEEMVTRSRICMNGRRESKVIEDKVGKEKLIKVGMVRCGVGGEYR